MLSAQLTCRISERVFLTAIAHAFVTPHNLIFLFLRTNFSLKLEDSQMILDFYNLFNMMLAPLSNIRISAEGAYKQFKSLLNKYQKGKPKKIKKKSSVTVSYTHLRAHET